MKSKILLALVIVVAIGAAVSVFLNKKKDDEDISTTPKPIVNLQQLNTKPIKDYPADVNGYTQGLEFYKGILYRSNGEKGKSYLAKYKANSVSEINDTEKMPTDIFAEGITIINDTIYQLTYQNNIVTKYNATTLQPVGTMPWKYGEGWGLTNNGEQLIASNGTSTIYFLNRNDLSAAKNINVNIGGTPVDQINELEYVDGFIFANQFTTDNIYKIDANNGNVLAVGDFKNLLPGYDAITLNQSNGTNQKYFNGIAYNPTTKTFFITGKNWPKLYEIAF